MLFYRGFVEELEREKNDECWTLCEVEQWLLDKSKAECGYCYLALLKVGYTLSKDIKDFLTDLMTTKEFIDMAQRMKVVELLNQGIVYSKIAEETGASTATISRVSRALNYGADGYAKVFEKINKLDVLVNNAGVCKLERFEDMD